jgi:branched-subunit amino acid aminotransferase/4-amino-4-deoxychorismate lyase
MAKTKAAAPLSMADRDGKIWYDGRLVEWRSATTHVLTHSLHYGLAVFEGVRAYKTEIGTAIFRLKEHTDRLFSSAHIYMMKIPFTRERLMEAQLEVVRANWTGRNDCRVSHQPPPRPLASAMAPPINNNERVSDIVRSVVCIDSPT